MTICFQCMVISLFEADDFRRMSLMCRKGRLGYLVHGRPEGRLLPDIWVQTQNIFTSRERDYPCMVINYPHNNHHCHHNNALVALLLLLAITTFVTLQVAVVSECSKLSYFNCAVVAKFWTLMERAAFRLAGQHIFNSIFQQ